MSDIVERLSKLKLPTPLMKEAKAEIERLRKEAEIEFFRWKEQAAEIERLRKTNEEFRAEIERLLEVIHDD